MGTDPQLFHNGLGGLMGEWLGYWIGWKYNQLSPQLRLKLGLGAELRLDRSIDFTLILILVNFTDYMIFHSFDELVNSIMMNNFKKCPASIPDCVGRYVCLNIFKA